MTMLSNIAAWQEVEAFYRREVLLLQDRRYREWLDTMDASITYRVPTTTSTLKGLEFTDNELGYYDENFELLQARVAKLESRLSWVEQPPSRLRYITQIVDIAEQDGADCLMVRSNFILLQYRWNMEQYFSGERTDTLKKVDGRWLLAERLAVLDRQKMGNQGLSVFF